MLNFKKSPLESSEDEDVVELLNDNTKDVNNTNNHVFNTSVSNDNSNSCILISRIENNNRLESTSLIKNNETVDVEKQSIATSSQNSQKVKTL